MRNTFAASQLKAVFAVEENVEGLPRSASAHIMDHFWEEYLHPASISITVMEVADGSKHNRLCSAVYWYEWALNYH